MRNLIAGLLTFGALAPAMPAAAQTSADLRATAPALEKNLTENILKFWYPGTIDREHGGFLIDHDAQGRFKGEGPKAIVTQARMVWLSARLMREGRGGPAMAEAARQGYRFLLDRMWDRDFGGFYWEVDRTGTRVVHANKHLYGQAFGLYAIAEYARATRDQAAVADARRLFDLIEARAHDATHGGYREFFARDWGPPPPEARPYLGGTADLKLMNTHLHLMEALTALYLADPSPRVAMRLSELITIQSNTVVRKKIGACTDQYAADWTPKLDGAAARASYGHDLENIWLLADALEALGQPVAPLGDLFTQLFAYSVANGYDESNGGFYDSGPLGQPADRRDKIWWVQAEALVSALTMYRLTGDPHYARVYLKTWAFTDTKQTDWTAGEWHPTVTADGRAIGEKANRWKAGYHNGRAMLEALRILRALGN
jgi:mannose/cellobiose epimerase-like protein (N-acyl-D-glucosamine 2-epimerase family)